MSRPDHCRAASAANAEAIGLPALTAFAIGDHFGIAANRQGLQFR